MTSYTVTASTTNNPGGGQLVVFVLDNAALAVTPATASSTTAYNVSITTTTAGSLVVGAVSDLNDDGLLANESNTTLTQFQDTSHDCLYAAYITTNTATPGPATVGATTAFNSFYGINAVEIIPAAAGNVTMDASSPAAANSMTATSFTTASFAPPASTVLAAMLAVDGGSSTMVPSISSTPSLTWTQQNLVNSSVSGVTSALVVWTALVPSAGGTPAAPGRQLPNVPVTVAFRAGGGAAHSR